MITNAQAFLDQHRPTFTVEADTSDGGLKMLADFDAAYANRLGFETSKAEMRTAYKALRKASAKTLKRQLKLAA